jgi:tetratricopeptide (TPR) repeat protein
LELKASQVELEGGTTSRANSLNSAVAQPSAVDLFDQAVQAFTNALRVYSQSPDWESGAKMDYGGALLQEASRSTGKKASDLSARAVQAYGRALEIMSGFHTVFATLVVPHGLALMLEGEWESGDKAITLLDQAVQGFRTALGGITAADQRGLWMATEYDLATALYQDGRRTSDQKAAALFNQAIVADQELLKILDEDGPQNSGHRTED